MPWPETFWLDTRLTAMRRWRAGQMALGYVEAPGSYVPYGMCDVPYAAIRQKLLFPDWQMGRGTRTGRTDIVALWR